ncbi:hypothetical protein ACFL1Y_00635 [Patescibacteria group bacterium]
MIKDFKVKNIGSKSVSRYQNRQDPHKKKINKKIYFVLALVLVGFVLFLFNSVLARVTVVVVPNTQNFSKDFEIRLTSNPEEVGQQQNVFLAEVAEANEIAKDNFNTTGEKDMGDKAQGKIVFYNTTGRSQPITTQIDLINDSGIVFNVIENMTIPGAKVDDKGDVVPGQIETAIQSKEAGEKGNAGPGRVNISALDLDRQSKVYGEIKSSLTGGNSKNMSVVSQEDLDNAKDKLIRELEASIKEKLKKKIGQDMYFSDNLIVYDDSEIYKEVEVDSEAKDFDMSLNLKIKALVYNNKELRIYLRNKVLDELPVGQMIAETEFGNLQTEVINFNLEEGLADLKIQAIFPVAEGIDVEEIKKNILGKKETEVRRYILSLPNVKNVQFSFSFNLNTNIPKNEDRVKVMLGDIK